MYINWSKIFLAIIYFLLTILLIILQLLIPLTQNGLIVGLIFTITTLFTCVLFASSAIAAFSKPLVTPNIAVALVSTITAVLLFLIQAYLFIRQIIDFLTIIFPK